MAGVTKSASFKQRAFITGLVGYFKYAEMKRHLNKIDELLRRRLRMCIWKSWKLVRTKLKNLVKFGIAQYQSWQWANTRKSYWHTSNSWILSIAIDNDKLRTAGYPTLLDCYRKYLSYIRNLRIPNGTYGGMRGETGLFPVSPTRLLNTQINLHLLIGFSYSSSVSKGHLDRFFPPSWLSEIPNSLATLETFPR